MEKLLSKENPKYELVKRQLLKRPKTWLVTGCAGFIGSHLVETLLKLNQKVVGLDNFATGTEENLKSVKKIVGPKLWKHFRLIRGDITKMRDYYKALGVRPPTSALRPQKPKKARSKSKVDIILHQAGLGSVPRSIADPLATHAANVTGTLNILVAARDAGVRRFVYASSSAVYGDVKISANQEEHLGNSLSPYAVSKHVDELYARVFGRCYGLETIGLRYFNVFGPRQDPQGAYAAVIPRWIGETQKKKRNVIYGDGKTTRDFVFVDEVVQANLLAATTTNPGALNSAYNVACGRATSLRALHSMIREAFQLVGNGRGRLGLRTVGLRTKASDLRPKSSPAYARQTTHRSLFKILPPRFLPGRQGDVRHSLASIVKARRLLGFCPSVKIRGGIEETVKAFVES